MILASLGRSEDAIAALDRALELAKGYGLLMPLAGEIIASDQLRALARSRLPQNPTWLEIEDHLSRAADLPEVGLFSFDGGASRWHIAVRSLGGLAVEVSGQESQLKPKAAELLLCLLEEGPVPLDSIVEQFWGHLDGGHQGANLHATIYHIRKKLGRAAIEVSKGVVRVSVGLRVKYDAREFLDAVSAAFGMREAPLDERLVALEEAASLYKGSFAPRLNTSWVRNRRRELEAAFVDTTIAYGRVALQAGEPERAVISLRRASSADPYREDVAAALVRCLWGAGRRAEAKHFSRSFVDLIRTDLDLGPGDEVTRLLQEIGEPALLSQTPPALAPRGRESAPPGQR
jgi:DNA-binding SARP family transcriptional activator